MQPFGVSLEEKIASEDCVTQIQCLTELLSSAPADQSLSKDKVEVLIAYLKFSNYRDLISDKISSFANQMIDELTLILHGDNVLDLKFWAAMLLLHSNVEYGVPLLLGVVSNQTHPWWLLAAQELAQSNGDLLGSSLLRVLSASIDEPENLTAGDADKISKMLDILNGTNTPVPQEIITKLASEKAPWQIKASLGLSFDWPKGKTK